MSDNADILMAQLTEIKTIPQDVLEQAVKLGAMVDKAPGVSVAIVFSNSERLDEPVPLLSGGLPLEQQLSLVLNNVLLAARVRGIPIGIIPAGLNERGECDCPSCRAKRAAAERVVN